MSSVDKKSAQLGMPIGTASNRLKKAIFFQLVREAGKNKCFRCQDSINAAEDLSIDHKTAWLDTDPELFWDLDNIAFSHLACNSSHARRYHKKISPKGFSWCFRCKKHLPLSEFYPGSPKTSSTRNGVKPHCKRCNTLLRREDRARR